MQVAATLREDLLDTVGELARSGRFDSILIESSGISEPMPVAATFEWTFDDGTSLSQHARLDTLVTVVDAARFVDELRVGDLLADRDLAVENGDERSISDLLVDQVFHPQRLLEALDGWEGVLRSKGFCRIATRPDTLAVWSQAGPNLVFEPGQLLGPDDRAGTELVFIGVGLDLAEPHRRLDPALLTDAELAEGAQRWRCWPDPLPGWASEPHGHVHDGHVHDGHVHV